MLGLGRWHLGALLCAGALRALHAARLSPQDALSGWDGFEYLSYARALASFEGCDYPRFADTIRSPGYPLFIAPFLALGDESVTIRAVQAVQVLLGLLSALVVRDLTARWRGQAAGEVAFFLVLFNPLVWYFGGFVLTEALFMLLLWGGMACLLRISEPGSDRLRWTVWGAVLMGTGSLVRPTLLVYLPLAAAWVLTQGRGASPRWRSSFGLAVTFTLISSATILPWLVGHRIVHGELTLSPRTSAFVYSYANSPQYLGTYEATSKSEYYRLQDGLSRKYMVGAGGSPETWLADAERFRRERPEDWRRLQLYKAVHFWRPWVNPLLFPFSRVVFSAAFTIPIFFLAASAVVRQGRALGPFGLMLLALVGVGWIVGGIMFHVQLRYRIPYVDVACTVLGAPAAVWGWERLRRARAQAAA